ncbi:hypothetical protein [Lysobacter gummosus]|uniref:Helix-hairpin-helix motif family protein n=1 Tax=Lysobacter gummosus TaxID=262324 RepID=A0ABY3X9N5_9GAMM|nr:hypothetical protein [Lysobacter gummosus]UNP29269.1 hypothetical protein MOV92_22830 [Lysobacter gummosus]
MMLKNVVAALILATLGICTSSLAQSPAIRIDATSSQSAESSYHSMMNGRSEDEQRKLALAVLVLNMEGVKSAHEVVKNSELDAPSISRIKDKVAGLTADEIVALASRSQSVRVEPGTK